MGRPIKNNKNLIQSYIMTSARYDLTPYEKRILYRIIKLASDELEEQLPNGKIIRAKEVCANVIKTLFGRIITIPVRDFLKDEKDKNYARAKEALSSIASKYIEYEDDEVWKRSNIIYDPEIDKRGSLATFIVGNNIWKAAMNFSKGYSLVDLEITFSFKSVYSMRMYELMSGQKNPITFGIDTIRTMFGVENKYAKTNLLEARIFDTAKAEMDEFSPISFSYQRITEASKGRNGERVNGYTFTPVFIHRNVVDLEQEKKSMLPHIGIGQLLGEPAVKYLIEQGFTREGLNRNKQTFARLKDASPDYLHDIVVACGKSRDKKNPQAYFIKKIRGMASDYEAIKAEKARVTPQQAQQQADAANMMAALANKFTQR